jgi:hypothetical protein
MSHESSTRKSVDDEQLAADAYNQTASERAALPPEKVQQLNLDVTSAASTVLGALPEVLALRPEAEKLGAFDATLFDNMEAYTLALVYANAQDKVSSELPDDLQELNTEGMRTRAVLFADTTALATRGLIPADSLSNYKGTFGYKLVAADIQLLVSVLRNNWARIEGKCGVTTEELDRAERLSHRMLRVVGLREQAPAATKVTADQRDRAFTLFMRSYDEIQRVVSYLRWKQNDADTIAPTLYAHRPRKARSQTAEPAAAQPLSAPASAQPPAQPADPSLTNPFMS